MCEYMNDGGERPTWMSIWIGDKHNSNRSQMHAGRRKSWMFSHKLMLTCLTCFNFFKWMTAEMAKIRCIQSQQLIICQFPDDGN